MPILARFRTLDFQISSRCAYNVARHQNFERKKKECHNTCIIEMSHTLDAKKYLVTRHYCIKNDNSYGHTQLKDTTERLARCEFLEDHQSEELQLSK